MLDTLNALGAPPARRGQAHLLLARSAVTASRFDVASEQLTRARRLGALAGDDALAARVEAVAAQLAIGEGRAGEAEALALRAGEAAAANGQPEVVCEALEVAGRCARLRDLDEAAAIGNRALQVAEDHGLAVWRMRGLYQLGSVDMFASGSVERLEQARDEARRLGAVATAASLDLEIGAGLEMQHRLDEALEALHHCIEMAALLGLRMLEAVAHVFIAVIAGERGSRRAMEDAIDRALALAGEDPETVGAAWGDARAVASLADEDRPRARRELQAAMEAFGTSRGVTPRPASALQALIVAIDGGDPDPAATEGITAVLHQAGGYLGYAEAVIHGRAGRIREAAMAAERGDRLLAGVPWYRHLVHRLSAEAAIADGWGDPASWLRDAVAFFDAAGNERLASACRGLLRRTGVRVARPTRASRRLPDRLRETGVTSREAEVLALVGEGLSNPEIATRLFLSERTVEHHVGWLKRKLNAGSRAQLVAYAAGIAIANR